ncbi:uncharacterized protein BJ171DRAFT_495285 [Polychytrium aggregatum]|uniref:uncharacterized protein n=1 Tax=Polychytrium aggregatum TaxID=110093 RepID=UPI0022FF09D9|nr:uncharacterized protein BJ171DRAFT_495285 [Polychytrium aggregatum]KAI9206960.1 hypothetical protein BJ171DRAFT_495285 [Polychytrium aggregatum]
MTCACCSSFSVTDPPCMIYMGKDKYENEELIKHAWEEDVWFHVDKLSSAHVYLRLPLGWSWADIPQEVLDDCAQLTKANSIEGNKKNNLTIIYTPSSNLKKTQGMETGQVTFHKSNVVKKVHVKERINEIVNRLNKTKEERYPDLQQELIDHERESRKQARAFEMSRKAEDLRVQEERRQQQNLKNYSSVMQESHMVSNKELGFGRGFKDIEEDFM